VSGLELRITDVEEEGARLLTTCALTILAYGFAVCPVQGYDEAALEIQIDDPLSHLTQYWKPIVLRQTYPLGLNPARPGDLGSRARRRWAELPERQAAAETAKTTTPGPWPNSPMEHLYLSSRSFKLQIDLPATL
jgi:hypothetical protein